MPNPSAGSATRPPCTDPEQKQKQTMRHGQQHSLAQELTREKGGTSCSHTRFGLVPDSSQATESAVHGSSR